MVQGTRHVPPSDLGLTFWRLRTRMHMSIRISTHVFIYDTCLRVFCSCAYVSYTYMQGVCNDTGRWELDIEGLDEPRRIKPDNICLANT